MKTGGSAESKTMPLDKNGTVRAKQLAQAERAVINGGSRTSQ